jgi:hypothetical protein
MQMSRLLFLLVVMSLAACGPTDDNASGTITSVAQDAKQARTQAQDAVSQAEAAARRVEAASQIPSQGDGPADSTSAAH